MSVDLEKVKQIAFLARIATDESHLKTYQNEMNQILGLVDEMQGLDLSKIEPMFHPIDNPQLLTEDSPIDEPLDELVFANAPKADKNLFLVPTVIE